LHPWVYDPWGFFFVDLWFGGGFWFDFFFSLEKDTVYLPYLFVVHVGWFYFGLGFCSVQKSRGHLVYSAVGTGLWQFKVTLRVFEIEVFVWFSYCLERSGYMGLCKVD
jgi:hypothetical protein